MKIKHILLLGAALCSSNGFINPAFAQTTAFTYQGRLNAGGAPANGNYDFCFALYDAVTNGNAVGIPQTNSAVAVSNGLFAVTLDFGSIFTGTNYWLDISVCPKGGTNFTELFPRQPILPVPYAVFANSASNLLGNLPAAQLSGTIASTQLPAGVVTNGAGGVNISGTFNGDGSGLTNLNGANLQPGTVTGNIIGSVDASQVNGLGTAATLDTNQIDLAGAGTVAAAAIGSSAAADMTNSANVFVGTFTGDGSGLTNLNGTNLLPGTVPGSAIGSVDASQVNGLGTAATNDAASFVASMNGAAAGLSINGPGSNDNLLTLWATNGSPALYINGDYRNGTDGERYRAFFAGDDPGFFDNGYIVLDGESEIYSLPAANYSILDIGQDVPHSIVTLSYSVENYLFESYVKSPFDGSITNSTTETNGYQVFGLMGDGRLDSWNLWGWHDVNPRIVLQENDYNTINAAFAIDTRSNLLIFGATTFSDMAPYAISEAGQVQNYQTNVTPGIVMAANGYVGIAGTNPLAVPTQALYVNGNAAASGTFMGDGSGLTNLNGTNLLPGTVPGSAIGSVDASQVNGLGTAATLDTNQIDLAGAGTAAAAAIGSSVAADMTNLANVFAGTFTGDGSGLTNLNGTNLLPGTVPGSAIGSVDASQVNGLGTAATLDTNQIDLAGAGTAAAAAIGSSVAADMTNSANVFAGTFTGDGSGLTNLNSSSVIAATNGFASFATNMASIDATGWTNNFGVNAMVYVNGTAGDEVMIYDSSAMMLFTNKLGDGTLPLELHPGWFFTGDNLNGTAVAE